MIFTSAMIIVIHIRFFIFESGVLESRQVFTIMGFNQNNDCAGSFGG